MKRQLTEEDRNALVMYRMNRAHETMKEAKHVADSGFYYAAINRLYYACYYMTVALLVKHNMQTATHNGVKTLLGLHFISKGKISTSVGKAFYTLYEKRQSGDYDDFVICDKEMVDMLFPQAVAFIEAIEQLINESEK